MLLNERLNMDNQTLSTPNSNGSLRGWKGSSTVSTIRLWNKIPSEMRKKQNLMGFKKSMLEHLLNSFCHVFLNFTFY